MDSSLEMSVQLGRKEVIFRGQGGAFQQMRCQERIRLPRRFRGLAVSL